MRRASGPTGADVAARDAVRSQSSPEDVEGLDVKITGKEQVNVKAVDKNLVIEAGKKKVMIKGATQIFLKCGKASISMAKSGNIVIKGNAINIKGSSAVTVKGKPIKLN